MSKRRKNAGAGYGYMFHGAFKKKADAVAKEAKTKGAWVRGTFTNQGLRYIVMSPRTNPRKTKPRMAKVVTKRPIYTAIKEGSYVRYYKDGREIAASSVPAVELRGLQASLGINKNPSELLIMAANPGATKHDQEIKIPLPGGGEVTIRTNPATRENSLGTFLGLSPARPTKKELSASRRSFKQGVREKGAEMDAESRQLKRAARQSQRQTRTSRVFHELYGEQKYGDDGLPINPSPVCGASIGGYPCSRKPGHRGPHLPQGATMRTRSRLRRGWQPQRNPSAEALREKFVGARVGRVAVMNEPHMPRGDYAMLGKLLSLYIKPLGGGQVMEMKAEGGTIIVSDESARQIYFVGGNQDLSSELATFGAVNRGAGIFELGEARRIDYKQRKEHVPHPESDSWRHDLGEENEVRPTVLFDANAKRILFEGGDYRIEEAGIIN